MKYKTKEISIEVEEYKEGLEDGFACYGSGRERQYKPPLCNLQCASCVLSGDMKPYILDGEDKTDIKEGDHVIVDEEGKKTIISKNDLEKYFKPVKDDKKDGKAKDK